VYIFVEIADVSRVLVILRAWGMKLVTEASVAALPTMPVTSITAFLVKTHALTQAANASSATAFLKLMEN
jgi:hypothetical protein